MSAKKNQQVRQSAAEPPADPAALAFLSLQVRDLLRFHQRLGITQYPSGKGLRNFLRKTKTPPQQVFQRPPRAPKPSAPAPRQPAPPALGLVHKEILDCRRCRLADQRSGQVPGRGAERPKLLVVGDWSRQEQFSGEVLFGREEDVMLGRMMAAIGLSEAEVYITNVIKCCPVDTSPDSSCAAQCFALLSREIAALQPRLILAMGEAAAGQLLAASAPLVRLRGRFHSYRYPDSAPAKVMPTFHPRFLLDNPEMKKMVWLDLQLVQRQL